MIAFEPQSDVCSEPTEGSCDGAGSWPDLWNWVFRYAYSLVRNHEDAEDITQETFVILFQESSSGRAIEKLNAWLRTVTRNVKNKQFRRYRPDLHTALHAEGEAEASPVFEPTDSNPLADQLVIEDNLLRIGAQVLAELPQKDRESVMMFFRGYDYSQIATALGVSRWTARRNTLKALQKLQNRINKSRS